MKPFKAAKRSIGDLDARTAASLIGATADVALVLDASGKIKDVSYGSQDIEAYGLGRWTGQLLQDVVTLESKPKIDEMLSTANGTPSEKWFQVNHPAKGRQDLPVRYKIMALNPGRSVIALGRDMLTASRLQQRLIAARNQIEKDYSRVAQAETRYQALFQFSSEAVLLVDAGTLDIAEANHAATTLLRAGSRGLAGRRLAEIIAAGSRPDVDTLLADARTAPRADPVMVQTHNGVTCRLIASLFRDSDRLFFLLRMTSEEDLKHSDAMRESVARMEAILSKLPEGIVIVDRERQILSANAAFLDLIQLATEEQIKGEPLTHWLGRVDVDTDILFAGLDKHEVVTQYKTVVRSQFGQVIPIDVSGVAALKEAPPCYGLIMRRDLTADAPVPAPSMVGTPQSIDHLKELVGRTSLKELVRQSTDIIERMCIEAALELTGDNRASAAEMLGLSRQGFYQKLRRHQLGGLGATDS
ncbi:MAG: transcriptional regulator PpsR [Pseudomonadota bacterium]